RARQDMGADFAALFDDADADLVLVGGGELLQADGGGEAGRAAADNHHVEFHSFPFAHPTLLAPSPAALSCKKQTVSPAAGTPIPASWQGFRYTPLPGFFQGFRRLPARPGR